MLMHHADPRRQCGAWIAGRQCLAEHFNPTFIGLIVTEQDVHQRGLTRAVFAQKGDDFATL